MMNIVVKSALQAISANDLKTCGIGAISRALEHEREVGLGVRGELRFVVMEADAYQRLRECELEIALQEARADFAAGRIVYESVDDHLKYLDAMAISPAD
jgi:hypothetical protein